MPVPTQHQTIEQPKRLASAPIVPSSQWTNEVLDTNNIVVNEVEDATSFFGVDLDVIDLGQSTLRDMFLKYDLTDSSWMNEMSEDVAEQFTPLELRLLKTIYRTHAAPGIPSDDLAMSLLMDVAAFDVSSPYIVLRQAPMRFSWGPRSCEAKPDVYVSCLSHPPQPIAILIQGDKSREVANQVPRLVADSLAAFASRYPDCQLIDNVPDKTVIVPGIFMMGSAMTFYKVHATPKLMIHLRKNTTPVEQTLVEYFCPPVPNKGDYQSLGIFSVENRRIVLECLLAFRKLTFGLVQE